jgi:hypothetical protein
MINATPQAIHAECVAQMQAGVCLTITPTRDPITVAGLGVIQPGAWNRYAALYNPVRPNDPSMCHLALDEMTAHPGSDMDVTARILWTPVLPTEQPAPVSVDAVAPVAVTAALMLALVWRMRGRKTLI